MANQNPKSHLLTMLLAFEGGILGFDRFYLGKIGTGMLKAITLGGFLIWWFVDLFQLCRNQVKDLEGNDLSGQQLRNPTLLIHLSAFGGILGMDRFYLGYTGLGFLKMCTLGGLGIWWLYDLYQVLTNKLKDARGLEIKADEKKQHAIALFFSFTSGWVGLDRHYLGYQTLAKLKFFTFGGVGIWYLLDIVQLILNSLKDGEGRPLEQSL